VQRTFDTETIYVFGHAFDPRAVTGSISEVNSFKGYFEKLLSFVSDEIKAGKSKEEILKATAITGVQDMNGEPKHNLEMAYDELTES
jgi:hypothetical protein